MAKGFIEIFNLGAGKIFFSCAIFTPMSASPVSRTVVTPASMVAFIFEIAL